MVLAGRGSGPVTWSVLNSDHYLREGRAMSGKGSKAENKPYSRTKKKKLRKPPHGAGGSLSLQPGFPSAPLHPLGRVPGSRGTFPHLRIAIKTASKG